MEEFSSHPRPDDPACMVHDIRDWVGHEDGAEKAQQNGKQELRKNGTNGTTQKSDGATNGDHTKAQEEYIFNGQLKVYLERGPLERRFFALSECEKLLYQLRGEMCVVVLGQSGRKEIALREGDILLLPSRTEHSFQSEDARSLCVVMERRRRKAELDCVRFYNEENGRHALLWEKWTHLADVRHGLAPIIEQFYQSDEGKTGLPSQNWHRLIPPYETSSAAEHISPVHLGSYANEHLDEIRLSTLELYGPLKHKCQVLLYAEGRHSLNSGDGDLAVMAQRGTLELNCLRQHHQIEHDWAIARIAPYTDMELVVLEGAICLMVKMLDE